MLEQFSQLFSANIPLHMIYLDPNNPRFSESDAPRHSEAEIDGDSLQKQIMEDLEKNFAVDRLIDSMESNGYLPVDRIIVKKFQDEKYVVLEGNRRVAAAKRLSQLHSSGKKDVDPRVLDSLKEIPVLIYAGTDQDAAWIFQGIRHISNSELSPARAQGSDNGSCTVTP